MFAQYSPLFTAGLLSDNTPSSSRSTSPKRRVRRSKKTTHDSLPLTVNSATFSVYAPHAHHESAASALYLTLKPSRRQRQEGHSFLSLDLADTLSLRRKDTVTSRATTVFSGREPLSPASPVPCRTPFAHSHVPSTSSTSTVTPRVATPVLRRASRETLRLPSPKPAPSASLPEVPAPAPVPAPATQNTHKRRPSNLTLTFSACFPGMDLSFPSPPPHHHRPTYSAPAVLSPLSADDANSSYFAAFSPTSPVPLTPPPTCTRPDSLVMPEPLSAPATTTTMLRMSPSCRSTVSLTTRQRNRSAALAALEGRTTRRRAASIKLPRNFMSMSDDEDDEAELAVETEAKMDKRVLSVLDEEEDVVEPRRRLAGTGSRRASKRASVSEETKRSRRSTIESFFAPLTNFIDLRDCEADAPAGERSSRSSRSWRSFVELAS